MDSAYAYPLIIIGLMAIYAAVFGVSRLKRAGRAEMVTPERPPSNPALRPPPVRV